MIALQPIANATNGSLIESHTLDIPPCCPVSKNPRPGSTVTLSYRPNGCSLEVANLIAYIHSFRGGLRNDQGELVVRDMEGMIMRIVADCERALGVRVDVRAELCIVPKQQVTLSTNCQDDEPML